MRILGISAFYHDSAATHGVIGEIKHQAVMCAWPELLCRGPAPL